MFFKLTQLLCYVSLTTDVAILAYVSVMVKAQFFGSTWAFGIYVFVWLIRATMCIVHKFTKRNIIIVACINLNMMKDIVRLFDANMIKSLSHTTALWHFIYFAAVVYV